MHTSFNLFLMFFFLQLLKLRLFCQKFLLAFVARFLQSVYTLGSKPASYTTLNIKSCLFTLFKPHRTAEVSLGVDNLVVSTINIKSCFFHLASLFTHHVRRLGFILVSLHLAFIFVWVIVSNLVCLRKSVVICNATSIVTEASKVGFRTLLFFYIDGNNFYLII